MTPEISAITAVATILQQVGAWPIGTVVVVVIIAPWIANVWITHSQDKRRERDEKRQEGIREEHERQFQAVKLMYENNVDLVKVAQRNSEALLDCVVANTMKWAGVEEKIDQNQWCPLARIRLRTEEIPQ
jgi:hypothetical protein